MAKKQILCFGPLRCANNPRCCFKSTQSSRSIRSKHTTSCFHTAGRQRDLTRAPKSLRRWCGGTEHKTSRVHLLQSGHSWKAAANALTEKAKRAPTHNVKRPDRLHTKSDKYKQVLLLCKMGSGDLNQDCNGTNFN